MKNFFKIALIIFSFTRTFAQSADEIAIRKVLSYQENTWNAASIDDFMKSYRVSDSLVFIGKTVTYGWQKTLENYQQRYPDTASMGKLSFDLVEIRPLSPGYYFVIGRWRIQRTLGNLSGYFTLLFQKINGQWLIIADHSS
ncbi:MAG: DUF4440 domain-containing protein [Ginsengibacter sp.]